MKIQPVGSKDIHRPFLPKASSAFMSFFPYSEVRALVTSAEDSM
jgi:hypothetical protein